MSREGQKKRDCKKIKKENLSIESKNKIIEKYKHIEAFKNIEDEGVFWMVMLFYLVWMQENENEKLWKDFATKIKYESHFFPECKLLKKVDSISEYASVELDKGTILYRAREYKDLDFFDNREIIALYTKINEFFPNLKLQLEDIGSESAMKIVSLALAGETKKFKELCKKVTRIADQEKPFWGFDEKGSDAPPKDYAKAGRANSVGISFLYAASDKKTAIMEMRPQIGQSFNVCKIEICKKIRIFDFTYTTGELKENEYAKAEDLYAISKEFSRNNYGNTEDYIPTQYLCEYIRKKGFDGIRYKSAVSPDGINLIIFNTYGDNKPYKVIESRVYSVRDMDLKFEQVLPFECKL